MEAGAAFPGGCHRGRSALELEGRAAGRGSGAVQTQLGRESSLKDSDIQAVVEHQSLSELYMALPVPTQLYFLPFYPA